MIKYNQYDRKNYFANYGEDGSLLNNWNPEIDYKNEYANIYFRINASFYRYPYNTYTKEEFVSFDEEAITVLQALGWEVKQKAYNGRCTTMVKGKARLYLHPQDISGEVLKNDIKAIAEALEENKTFHLELIQLYETYYDISNQEYESYLETKKEDIKNTILYMSKTPRRNRFYKIEIIISKVAEIYQLNRVDIKDDYHNGLGQTASYIRKIIEELIQKGYLVKAVEVENNREYIRTINKKEQKEKKLFVA